MSFVFLILGAGIGFSACLAILGNSERDLIDYAHDLQKENSSLKVKFLNNCWNIASNEDESPII